MEMKDLDWSDDRVDTSRIDRHLDEVMERMDPGLKADLERKALDMRKVALRFGLDVASEEWERFWSLFTVLVTALARIPGEAQVFKDGLTMDALMRLVMAARLARRDETRLSA